MLLSNYSGYRFEAGVDEAGRGCLAGPVVAAAVLFPPNYAHPLLNDSKKLSKAKRYQLRDVILDTALAWGIGKASPAEIDEVNILNATFLAMHRAIENMQLKAEYLIIDGNRFKTTLTVPHSCIIKGDGKYLSIAAASILAKTHRDDLLKEMSEEYQEYGWDQNAGYPTKAHRDAIAVHGVTPHHRQTFALLPKQLSLFK
jgi:ribonuclease HII